jgi:F0F1-type ATP synthase assembly protein I
MQPSGVGEVFHKGTVYFSTARRSTMARLPEDPRTAFLQRSLKALQENIRRSAPAAAAGYTLIGGIVLFGGLGYAMDQWRGTSPWWLLTGLLVGIVVGFYELAKIVWRR